MKKILYLTIMVFATLISCDDDSPVVVENPCLNIGYEQVNGKCACPEGKHSAYGFCRETKPDEWFGISADCHCADTLFFWIQEFDSDGRAKVKVNQDITFNNISEFEQSRLRFSNLFDYYALPDGDSIASSSLVGDLPCQFEGTSAELEETTFYGKFSPDKQELKMKLIVRDGKDRTIIRDSCVVTFVK